MSNHSPSHSTYRLISGIRTARPNPIVIKKQEGAKGDEIVEAARPETSRVRFKAYQYDKDYAFHYIQQRWFQRKLELGEQLTLTADHLKMICDEVHEMGRLRERNRKGCTCQLESR